MMRRALNVGFSGGEKKRNEMLQMALLEPRARHPRRDRFGPRHRRAEGRRRRHQRPARRRSAPWWSSPTTSGCSTTSCRTRSTCSRAGPHRPLRRQGACARAGAERLRRPRARAERGGLSGWVRTMASTADHSLRLPRARRRRGGGAAGRRTCPWLDALRAEGRPAERGRPARHPHGSLEVHQPGARSPLSTSRRPLRGAGRGGRSRPRRLRHHCRGAGTGLRQRPARSARHSRLRRPACRPPHASGWRRPSRGRPGAGRGAARRHGAAQRRSHGRLQRGVRGRRLHRRDRAGAPWWTSPLRLRFVAAPGSEPLAYHPRVDRAARRRQPAHS